MKNSNKVKRPHNQFSCSLIVDAILQKYINRAEYLPIALETAN